MAQATGLRPSDVAHAEAADAVCRTCQRITPQPELIALRGQCGDCWTRHEELRYEGEQRILGGAA